MSVFNFIFGNKTSIDEKVLKKNNIPILHYHDLSFDKKNLLTITISAKLYKGYYKKKIVTIKIIEIQDNDDLLLTEFLLWRENKNRPQYLQLQGVIMTKSEAIIIFDPVVCTLELALQKGMLKIQQKLIVAGEILNLINLLQSKNKIIRDLRPGILALDEHFQMKLLDFGFIVTQCPPNLNEVELSRIKYLPPEGLQFDFIDRSSDIWSIGCVLIDIFSDIQPIYKNNLTREEVYNGHDLKIFPVIPGDINGFLKDIITKCLDRNYESRIQAEDLLENWNIFFSVFKNNENDIETVDRKDEEDNIISSNKALSDARDFVMKVEKSMSAVNKKITDELLDKANHLKRHSESVHKNTQKELGENYSIITTELRELFSKKNEIIDKFYNKLIVDVIGVQQFYSIAISEILDAQNIINDMKLCINSLSKLQNPEKYSNLMETLQKNREIVTNHINEYSKNENYDIVYDKYDENKKLYDQFKTLAQNKELLMVDIIDFLKIHKINFIDRSNIKDVSQTLNLGIETSKEFKSQKFQSYFAKIQENSNLVIIYDTDQKKFLKIPFKLKNMQKFPGKCFSLYYDNTIFYCGGQPYSNKSILNTTNLIKISLYFEEFKFEEVELANMIYPRHSHSLIKYKTNFIIAVSGYKNKTCEIYDMGKNQWFRLPSLLYYVSNPCLFFINEHQLYCLGTGSDYNSTETISKLAMDNLSETAEWELLPYCYDYDFGRLYRGMQAIVDSKSDDILLMGGFDTDNYHDVILKVDLNYVEKSSSNEESNNEETKDKNNNTSNVMDDKKDKKDYKKIDISNNNDKTNKNAEKIIKISLLENTLPIRTSFNANYLHFDKYIIMVDRDNNSIEIDFNDKQFYYFT